MLAITPVIPLAMAFAFLSSILQYTEGLFTLVRKFTFKVRKGSAGSGILTVVITVVISVFIGAILLYEFQTIIRDRQVLTKGDTTSEFNDTTNALITYAWVVFAFLGIGILIVGGSWVLRQTGTLGT